MKLIFASLSLLSFVLFEVHTTYNNKEFAGNKDNNPGNKTSTATQNNNVPNEKPDVNSSAVNESTGNDKNEKAPVSILTVDEDNKLSPQQNIKQAADKNPLPESNITKPIISKKDIAEIQSDRIISGHKKKLTAKSA